MPMLANYRNFLASRNVLDWAVGLVLGSTFEKAMESLIKDILWPPVVSLFGKIDFNDFFFTLSPGHYNTLAQARSAGAVTINYGAFANHILDLLVNSVVVYWLVIRLRRNNTHDLVPSSEPTRECPECVTTISIRAKRCPHCTAPILQP